MKYRILLDAFTLRRDLMINYVFASLLAKRGCDVKISCCRNFKTYLRNWKPDAVVLSVPGRIAAVSKLLPDSTLFFYPGEGGEPEKVLYENWYFKRKPEEYRRIDHYFMWGEYNRRVADANLPEFKAKRSVAGNLRLDIPKYSPVRRTNEPKNSIGIIGRFTTINNYTGKPTIITLSSPEDRALNQVLNQCRQFHAIIKLIDHIIKNTSFNISIRPHPLEAPEGYERMLGNYPPGRLSIDDSFDYAAWSCSQRMVFAPASTTFIEAYIQKVPLVNVDRALGIAEEIGKISPFAALSHKCSYAPETMDELYSMLNCDLQPKANVPEIDEHLRDIHNWNTESSVLMKVCDEIMEYFRKNVRPKFLRKPSAVSEAIDWYHFLKATYWGSRLHPNFNYKRGYHKIPAYYGTLIENIRTNNVQVR